MARQITDDGSLKRLGGGRWQTRDARFTIEPQSGTWVVLDAEQTDDLGLPLVRGPFGSLTAAKDAIAGARGAEPTVSPLAARMAEHDDRPAVQPTRGGRPYLVRGASPPAIPELASEMAAPPAAPPAAPLSVPPAAEPEMPPEPQWIRDLEPTDRARAHALTEKLADAGAADPEALAEREIVGGAAAVAAFAVERALATLGPDATPGDVAAVLAEGGNEQLGVKWRLVDGDGRPINLGREPLTH